MPSHPVPSHEPCSVDGSSVDESENSVERASIVPGRVVQTFNARERECVTTG